MNKELNYIIRCFYYGFIIIAVYLFLRYAFPFLAPFIFAFLIAYLFQSLIIKFAILTHIPRKISAFLTLSIFYFIIALIFYYLISIGFEKILELSKKLPLIYQDNIEPMLNHTFMHLKSHPLSASISDILDNSKSNIDNIINIISSKLLSFISHSIKVIPALTMRFICMIMASYIIVWDYPNIMQKYKVLTARTKLWQLFSFMKKLLKTYVIAYSKICLITFVECAIGFAVIGVESPLLIAFGISIFDILPVLGSGGIFIPWMLFLYINHQVKMSIGLLIIYLIICCVRTFIEPRIVGKQLGLPSILLFIGMYVGSALFGIWGFFTMPFILVAIKEYIIYLKKNLVKT